MTNEKVKKHPFTFSDESNVYFCDSFPIAVINRQRLNIPNEMLAKLIKDIQQNGIEKPFILELKDQTFNVVLGSKRLLAASILEITHIKALLNFSNDEFAKNNTLLPLRKLQNSDQVIELFGGMEKIDINHLYIDENNRLFCVGSDHEQWCTSERGKNPREWYNKVLEEQKSD